MIKALNELRKNKININHSFDQFIKGKETKVINNSLYYKNIPEGLVLLLNPNLKVINNELDHFGTMLDLSRGAVFKVSYLKELIYKKALMGVNQIWLYMEDTYTLPKHPNFGYLRGKYSKDELKEIVNYAKIFDIEIIPAIQTLGHHEQFLKWSNEIVLKDQNDILLIDEPKTYEFIEYMLKWLYDVFDTTTIHLGLDETFGVGFGNYYKKNGYQKPIDLFNRHLQKIVNISEKIGFKKHLIWSDMYFRFLSENNNYYDLNIKINENIIKEIPKSVSLVYWDYYNSDKQIVKSLLKSHLDTKLEVVFASGTWIWTRFSYDKTKTDKTALMHLEETLNHNLKSFILTQWMDDGAYGIHQSTLLGVFELSNKLFNLPQNNDNYKLITNMSFDKSVLRTKINDLSLELVGLIWDDPLLGIFVNNYLHNDENKYKKVINEYGNLEKEFQKNDKYSIEHLLVLGGYFKLLARHHLIKDYQKKNKTNKSIKYYKKYIKVLDKLIVKYRNNWYVNYKINGFEILQSRLVTQLNRAKEMIYLIKEYKRGNQKMLSILDEQISINEYVYPKYSLVSSSTIIR